MVFFFQAEDGIRDLVRSRGLGDVYKRQVQPKELWAMCLLLVAWWSDQLPQAEAQAVDEAFQAVDTSVVRSGLSMIRDKLALFLSLIHI